MKQSYRKIILSLIVLVLAAVIAPPLLADGNIQVANSTWDSEFGDHLSFSLEATGPAEIDKVELLYRVVGQLATSRNEAKFTPGTSVTASFTIDQTKPENYMPPGAELEYWWKIEDAAGNQVKTDKQTITIVDNRYEWQSLENDRLTLYWYAGDQKFGPALFDRANKALDTLSSDMGISLENPIKIFIYGSHRDLLGAINSTSPEWTGGQALPDYGVVVIGIEPNSASLAWGLDAMTHEMTHLVVHQATDNPYSDLPRWLDEGIAVYNENPDQLDQDFRPLFQSAVANNKLMTLRTLSSPFPSDTTQANLAYGESGAVVKFIIDTYGSQAMAKLLNIFSEGALYDEALQQALGVDTDGLDNAFRQSLGLPPLPGTQIEAAPQTNSEDTAAPQAESQVDATTGQNGAAAAEESVPQSEEAAPTANEQAQPAPAAKPANSASGLLPCLAGLVAIFLMGGLVYGRQLV